MSQVANPVAGDGTEEEESQVIVRRRYNKKDLANRMKELANLRPLGKVSDAELISCLQLLLLARQDPELFVGLQPEEEKEAALKKVKDARQAAQARTERVRELMGEITIDPEPL